MSNALENELMSVTRNIRLLLLSYNNQFNIYFNLFFFVHIENIFNNIFLYSYNTNFFKFLEVLPEFIFLLILIAYLFIILKKYKNFQYDSWVTFLFNILILYMIKIFIFGLCFNGTFFIFNYCLLSSFFILSIKIFIILLTIFYFILVESSFKINKKNIIKELPWLICLSIFLLFSLISSFDFFLTYVCIESLSIILYGLCSLINNNVISKEAAFKYLALGSMSSGILLLGISWIYGIIGSLNYLNISYFLIISSNMNIVDLNIKFSTLFILLAFFFKLAAFPCYFWIADIYSNIWTPITFFFATIIKFGFCIFFFKLLYSVFFSLKAVWSVIILVSAVGSLIIGSIGALYQNELKKFIAYASINQVGFLFLSISNCSFFGFKAAISYLVIYTIMNFIFFGILTNTLNLITGRNLIYFSDLNGISNYNQFISIIFSIMIFSMAGIPPLAGFFTKFYVFCSVIQGSNYIYTQSQTSYYTLIYALILTILSSFYYINILKQLFFEKSINGQFFWFKKKIKITVILIILVLFLISYIFYFNTINNCIELLSVSCISPFLISTFLIF